MDQTVASVESILALAVEIAAPAERQAFVDKACTGNADLRAKVERLMANHFRAGSFLEHPAAVLETVAHPAPGEIIGTQIGPYKLLEQIGEGGMGVVYVAEQKQPVRRTVALKLIKPGMDSKQVVARFEAERQALALMDHPNIAKVLDAGTVGQPFQADSPSPSQPFQADSPSPSQPGKADSASPSQPGKADLPIGRPYFVMELVRGIPITDYCDQARLTVRQRLEVFVQVCRAVQHAHTKGVIHRDIKPSNVLVTSHDGVPMPMVIDFGVAKALGQQLTEQSLHTGFAQMIGTPLYMSPEQAEFNQLGVDTRSDIYSLGVLLYELLTGVTPFDRERLRTVDYDEFRRILREEEPPRPSARLSTLEAALSTASERRGVDPRKLTQTLRGELDWIVMKCLEKDRNRRYETASGLAADVQRYLNDEPVEACPPSVVYKFRKFARRNRAFLVVATTLGLALIAVAGSVGWMMRDRATRHQQLLGEIEYALRGAEQELAAKNWVESRTAVLRARSLLATGAGDDRLDQRAAGILKDLAMVAALEETRLESTFIKDDKFDWKGSTDRFAEAFWEYGIDVESLPAEESAALIRPKPIAAELVAGLDFWGFCEGWGKSKSMHLLAVARLADSDVVPWRRDLRKALEQGEPETIQRLVQDAEQKTFSPSAVVLLAIALDNVGLRNGPAPNRGSGNSAVKLLRKAQVQYPDDFWINHTLAEHLEQAQPPRLDEAIGFYRAALALRSQSPGVCFNLGTALKARGDLDGALASYQKAIDLKPDFAKAHNGLGRVLAAKGDTAAAIAAYHKAISLKAGNAIAYNDLGLALYKQRDLTGAIAAYQQAVAHRPDFANALNNLGYALNEKGDPEGGIAAYRTAMSLNNFAAAHNLGNLLKARKDFVGAAAAFQKAVLLKPDDAQEQNNLGTALLETHDLVGAAAAFQKAIDLKSDYFIAQTNLAVALRGQGDRAGAIAVLKKVIASKPDHARAHFNLGLILQEEGELGQALISLRRGHELGVKEPNWPAYSAGLIRECERLVELDGKLPDFLAGKSRPADPAEGFALAKVCWLKRHYQEAIRFYEQAFAADPQLAGSRSKGERYDAACVAALAGCGQGKDSGKIDDKERARFRRQAQDWLRADLAAWRERLEKEFDQVHPVLLQRLTHWQKDSDLAGVRDPDGLAKLPSAEQEAWCALWAEVAKTVERVRKTNKAETTRTEQSLK